MPLRSEKSSTADCGPRKALSWIAALLGRAGSGQRHLACVHECQPAPIPAELWELLPQPKRRLWRPSTDVSTHLCAKLWSCLNDEAKKSVGVEKVKCYKKCSWFLFCLITSESMNISLILFAIYYYRFKLIRCTENCVFFKMGYETVPALKRSTSSVISQYLGKNIGIIPNNNLHQNTLAVDFQVTA